MALSPSTPAMHMPRIRSSGAAFFTRRAALIAGAAAVAAPPLAAAAAPTPRAPLQIAGPWEMRGLAPAVSGYMFTRLQIAETLLANPVIEDVELHLETQPGS